MGKPFIDFLFDFNFQGCVGTRSVIDWALIDNRKWYNSTALPQVFLLWSEVVFTIDSNQLYILTTASPPQLVDIGRLYRKLIKWPSGLIDMTFLICLFYIKSIIRYILWLI